MMLMLPDASMSYNNLTSCVLHQFAPLLMVELPHCPRCSWHIINQFCYISYLVLANSGMNATDHVNKVG